MHAMYLAGLVNTTAIAGQTWFLPYLLGILTGMVVSFKWLK
jgi:hypothetical protein